VSPTTVQRPSDCLPGLLGLGQRNREDLVQPVGNAAKLFVEGAPFGFPVSSEQTPVARELQAGYDAPLICAEELELQLE